MIIYISIERMDIVEKVRKVELIGFQVNQFQRTPAVKNCNGRSRLMWVNPNTGRQKLLNVPKTVETRRQEHSWLRGFGCWRLSCCHGLLVMEADDDNLLTPICIIFCSFYICPSFIFLLFIFLLYPHDSTQGIVGLLLLQRLQGVYHTIKESEETI